MGFLLGFFQFELCPAGDDIQPEFDEFRDQVRDIEGPWPALDQGNVVDPVGGLELAMLIKLVDDDIGHSIPLQVDDDAGAFAFVGFVVDMRDAFNDLFIDQLTDTVAKRVAVHLVGNLGDDDLFPAAGLCIDLYLATEDHPAPAEVHGGLDAFHAVDDPARREIGRLYMYHQFLDGDIPFFDIGHTTIDHFREIVRHHIGGHPDGDAAGAIHQQLGETGRQDRGFRERVIKVGLEVHRFLVDVFEHVFGLAMKAVFNIPHRRSTVPLLITKVTLAVHQQIAHTPFLGHTDHGVKDGGVPVGVIFTHHFPDDTGGFLMRFVAVIAEFVHAVEDTSMYGLHHLPDIAKDATDNDRHRIVDVGRLHLLFYVYRDNTIIIL